MRQISLPLLLLTSVFVGCSGSVEEAVIPDASQSETLRLQVVRPETREIFETITGTGTIGAAQTSNLGVVTPGIIERIFVKVGDRVDKGQPLFQTRKADFEIAVQLARAERRAAESRVAQARLDFERATELFEKQFISQAQLDTAENSLQAATAERDVTGAKLAQAEQRLVDTVVRAPYNGVITERKVDEGTYKSTQSFSADSAVLQIQKIDVVVAAVRVPEIHLESLSLGTPATLHIDGLPTELQSEIFILNDKADMTSRSLDVRFGLLNKDYRIKTGLFVRAEIRLPGRTAMLLNREAVLDRSHNPRVFVLADGTAKSQKVVIKDFDAATAEVVSGLPKDAQVLLGPDLIRLVEGKVLTEIDDAHR